MRREPGRDDTFIEGMVCSVTCATDIIHTPSCRERMLWQKAHLTGPGENR